MTDIAASRICGQLCELHHLAHLAVNTRLIFQSGGEPHRARRELLLEQRRHRLHFFIACGTFEVRAHDLVTQGVVAGVGGNIDFGRCGLERRIETCQGIRRIPILTDHCCGDALGDFGQCVALGEDQPI